MAPTRVLFARLPGILHDIVRAAVESDRGFEIVGTASVTQDLAEAVRAHRARVLVMGMGTSQDTGEIVRHLPDGCAIVAIDAEGRSAERHRAGRGPRRVSDLSSASLLAMLREAADGGPTS